MPVTMTTTMTAWTMRRWGRRGHLRPRERVAREESLVPGPCTCLWSAFPHTQPSTDRAWGMGNTR